MSKGGNTNTDAKNARIIITAVSIPKDANNGIGANPIMANPATVDNADTIKETPVPRAECLRASILSPVESSS